MISAVWIVLAEVGASGWRPILGVFATESAAKEFARAEAVERAGTAWPGVVTEMWAVLP